jgi:hypothetical protein
MTAEGNGFTRNLKKRTVKIKNKDCCGFLCTMPDIVLVAHAIDLLCSQVQRCIHLPKI